MGTTTHHSEDPKAKAAATTFPLFSLLPSELRLAIYALAMPQRTLPITCEKGVNLDCTRYIDSYNSSCPAPALLCMSPESRSAVLPFYKNYFRAPLTPHGIPVNFAHDTLVINEGILVYLTPSEISSVQFLVVEVHDPHYFGHFNFDVLREMTSLKGLELRVWEATSNNWSWESQLESLVTDYRAEFGGEGKWGWGKGNGGEVRFVDAETGKVKVLMEQRGEGAEASIFS